MADYPLSGRTSPLGVPHRKDLQIAQGSISTVLLPVNLSKQGGIGFQYEGGIITVVANPLGVDVNFDRPMIYNGNYTSPDGNPFILGPPTLNGTATSLDLPITIASESTTMDFIELAPAVRQLVIKFSGRVYLTAAGLLPSSWTISTSDPGAVAVTVTNVVVSGTSVVLTTTEATSARVYNLTMPSAAIFNALGGTPYTGGLVKVYSALGDAPFVASAFVQDTTTIVLIFNEEVKEAEALNAANYTVTPTLPVISVAKQDSLTYRITVGGEILPIPYTVTIANISDFANNYI